MDVRVYQATTMQEALALVREELGPDAAILHTREIRPGFLGRLLGRRQIEVTASLDVNVPSRLTLNRTRRNAVHTDDANDASQTQTAVLDEPCDPQNLRGSPDTTSETMAAQDSDLDTAWQAKRATSNMASDTATSQEWQSTAASSMRETRQRSQISFNSPRTTEITSGITQDVRGQISDLHMMLQELVGHSSAPNKSSPSEVFFRLFADLLDAEIPESFARTLIDRVRGEQKPDQPIDMMLLRARILRQIESEIRCSGPIQVRPGAHRVVALIGPTGVGKTTTIAKLAANYRLREQCSVGLITVDTYRIAAVEQIRTYAEIIDLPMQVVSSPYEIDGAIQRMQNLDLILIDTAGRSPRDTERLQELQEYLARANADEVHLVLSTTASARSLTETAKQFAIANPTHLILTKLDEATGLGGVCSLLREGKMPLSYLTNGQNVPDDIDVANASQVARAILGIGESMPNRSANIDIQG
ncbi:MAG: flagellar biosynthesis protein FlhF [Thermoguttaceae bacterium]|nr:flagellar biosynthesis protein FlhF [Thermoguttaceae bacterium]